MSTGRIKRISHGFLVVLVIPAWAADKPEQPVGLVVASHDARLLRAGTGLTLGAKPGDILFVGDSLQTGAGGSATFLFCPDSTSRQLREFSDVEADTPQLRIAKGGFANQTTTPICSLPLLERASAASKRDFGPSIEAAALSNVPAVESLDAHLDLLPDDQRSQVAGELAKLDQAIRANPQNLAAQVARAVILERSGLQRDAANQYRTILARWPDAVWAGARAFDNDEQGRGTLAAPRSTAGLGGRTYALIVGISAYQNTRVPSLRYAHADAELFEQHLRSPRGGGLTGSEIIILTNQKATLAAIRNGIDTLLKVKAGKTDTIILFFAAHGTSVGTDGYILAADSDPQDLKDTALPMSEVQALFMDKLRAVGRVVLYVDVCHAGVIGSIRGANKINDMVSTIADENEIFGILASRKNQLAYEGLEYGGHGVFSLYLVQALNGAAKDQNGVIDAVSVAEYVQSRVELATQRKQQPREIGNADDTTILADLTKAGLELDKVTGPPLVAALDGPQSRVAGEVGSANGPPASLADDRKKFEEALEAGLVLPGAGRSAFTYLPDLQRSLPAREYVSEENRLRIKLEDMGQQILLTYLQGEEVPQTRADFRAGASLCEAAQRLTPESQLLRARRDFFLGRAALFDKDYAGGIPLLERAARADSTAAYPYNALGIAYLALADYDNAVLGFRDAIKRAPYWAYPRYNLALTLADEGDYSGAEREYREAIRLAPGYSYVHYGLGLLLHKLGRQGEAEREYLFAIQANPKRPEPYVGLGALEASFGRKSKAEQNYLMAIRLDPAMAAAPHDLGLLYAQEKKPDRAIEMWAGNVARNPDFIPSRMSLADAYRDRRRYDAAIEQYRAVLSRSHEYAAAIMALHETLGDREQQDHRLDRARQEYRDALAIAVSDDDRKRLARKLRK